MAHGLLFGYGHLLRVSGSEGQAGITHLFCKIMQSARGGIEKCRSDAKRDKAIHGFKVGDEPP
mgnify:CR=1 FL=1